MDKIILNHKDLFGNWNAFDFLIKKELFDKYKNLKDDFCEINSCEFVKEFIKNNKDFLYLGSEDLNHIEQFNVWVENKIIELKKDGFVVIRVEDKSATKTQKVNEK